MFRSSTANSVTLPSNRRHSTAGDGVPYPLHSIAPFVLTPPPPSPPPPPAPAGSSGSRTGTCLTPYSFRHIVPLIFTPTPPSPPPPPQPPQPAAKGGILSCPYINAHLVATTSAHGACNAVREDLSKLSSKIADLHTKAWGMTSKRRFRCFQLLTTCKISLKEIDRQVGAIEKSLVRLVRDGRFEQLNEVLAVCEENLESLKKTRKACWEVYVEARTEWEETGMLKARRDHNRFRGLDCFGGVQDSLEY